MSLRSLQKKKLINIEKGEMTIRFLLRLELFKFMRKTRNDRNDKKELKPKLLNTSYLFVYLIIAESLQDHCFSPQ